MKRVASSGLVPDGELEGGSWRPWRGEERDGAIAYRWWVLVAVCAGLFATGLTVTALTTAVPFIQRDFGTSIAAITWVVSAPFLFRAIFVPAFGKVADRSGRRRVWCIGFAVSATASLACGFAPSVGWLILFRAVAAIGGAAVVPSSLALIAVVFPPEERVKAYGWWSATAAGSPLVGVVLGGLVIEAFGWRWLFFGQFPFALVALVLGWLVLRESRGERARFDLGGTILSVVGLGSVILLLNRGPVGTWAWGSAPMVGVALLAVTCLVAFVAVELRVASPIVPVRLFRRRPFTAGVAASFCGNFAYMGGFFITSLMLAEPGLFGYSAAMVAWAVAPRAVALAAMGPVAGYLAARFGGRRMATTGMVAVAASMVMLAALTPDASYWWILPGLLVSGVGLGLIGPPAVAAVTNEAPDDDLGAAGAAVNLGAAFGTSMGIATMQAVLVGSSVGGAPTMAAFSAAFLAGAVVTVLGIGATLGLGPPNRVGRVLRARRRAG